MANNSIVMSIGDVIWVPYRRDPLWPAKVCHVYPKKVTYTFFPLEILEDNSKKPAVFSSHPKSTYALTIHDELPEGSQSQLVDAFKSACDYLKEKGLERGSAIPTRKEAPPTPAKVKISKRHVGTEKTSTTKRPPIGTESDESMASMDFDQDTSMTSVTTNESALGPESEAIEQLEDDIQPDPVDVHTNGSGENGVKKIKPENDIQPDPVDVHTNGSGENGVKKIKTENCVEKIKIENGVPSSPSSSSSPSPAAVKEVVAPKAVKVKTDEKPSSSSPSKSSETVAKVRNGTVGHKRTNNGLNGVAQKKINRGYYFDTNERHVNTGLSKSELKKLAEIVSTNLEEKFKEQWSTERLRNFVKPPRESVVCNFYFAHFFDYGTTDDLVERVVKMVREQDSQYSLVLAMHLACTCVIPPMMVDALMKLRSIKQDEAQKLYDKPATMSKNSSSLEELVRLACRERESLSD